MTYRFRCYRGGDEEQIINLWNRCLTRDPVTREKFRRKILLDENFDPRGCHVAESGKHVVGVCLALRRRFPYYGLGLEAEKGWITLLFVHPDHRRRGIASGLLDRSEEFLKKNAVRDVLVSPYTPNYIIPGVDVDAYADAHRLLRARGYKGTEKVYSMGRSLLDFRVSEEMTERCASLEAQGISIKPFESHYTVPLLDFLGRDYPGDLFRTALECLRAAPNCDEILIAVKEDEVVGFSHFEQEHFGPFAVAPSLGGRGIGTCLYYRTAAHMKERGHRNLWLAWTTGHAKDFYHKMGLKTLRRHEIMSKSLSEDRSA